VATILVCTRHQKGIAVENTSSDVQMQLSHEHPIGKLFPEGQDRIFVKASVKNGQVTVINAVKAGKFFGRNIWLKGE
jgi:hypothetical protein